MKEAYLRGYYGYKNFGDELLLFGIIEYLLKTYSLEKLIIEVGSKKWIDERTKRNATFMPHHAQIQFVEIKQHKWRRLTHITNLIGRGKYKHVFKFFGGGEVLTDERPFPHDGRNIPLLFNRTIRRGAFTLLGGIGTPKTYRSRLLYKDLLHRAKELVLRDPISIKIVEQKKWKVQHERVKFHEDFSLSVLRKFKLSEPPLGAEHGNLESDKSILVNINTASLTSANIHKIQLFCKEYPDHKIIYFPCDMDDDFQCFDMIKSDIPGIELYDWTKHTLEQTIQLFLHTEAGIGSRLHFLLLLKFFNTPFQSISKAEKVHKMINTP